MAPNGIILGTENADVLATDSEGQSVYGLGGNDFLTSAHNSTRLDGGDGDDRLGTVIGTAGAGLANAVVRQFGGEGADELTADAKANVGDEAAVADVRLYGGNGADDISATGYAEGTRSWAINRIDAGNGDNVVDASAGALAWGDAEGGGTALARNTVRTGDGNDIITANVDGLGFDNLLMENVIRSGDGNDVVVSVCGDSIDQGGIHETARNVVFAGGGNDRVEAAAYTNENGPSYSHNELHGGSGDDELIATASISSNDAYGEAANQLFGDAGNDQLSAVLLGSYLYSDSVLNFLDGGDGDDVVSAEMRFAGTPLLAQNRLFGGDGSDTMSCTSDVSEYSLGFENPVMRVVTTVSGGAGNDSIAAASSGEGFTVLTNRLSGGTGDDTLSALADIERFDHAALPEKQSFATNILRGGIGADTVTAEISVGTPGRSLIYGDAGNDWLRALGGQDNRLFGGGGRDRVVAGDGSSELHGGAQTDTFVFYISRNHANQAIADFEGDLDRLRVIGLTDGGAPGLVDDLAARAVVSDDGFDVTLSFDSGTELVFAGLGTGSVDSFADLVVNVNTQLIA